MSVLPAWAEYTIGLNREIKMGIVYLLQARVGQPLKAGVVFTGDRDLGLLQGLKN